MGATVVTPSGVRDGDPAALAGLCDRRGPAVLAYCRHVAGDAVSEAAAAEAFGEFRAAVHAAEDPASINPESLLLNATRHAAAARAGIVAMGICAAVPKLLAARADRSIARADRDRLEEHLETCWTCRAPVARFKAAERAYRDPPEASVPPEAAAAIVAAMTAAAPLPADEPPPAPEPAPPAKPAEPVPAAMNGSGQHDAGARPPVPLAVPTTERRSLGRIGSEPGPADPSAEPPRPPSRAQRPPRGARVAPLAGGTHLPRPHRAGASERPERAPRPARRPQRALRPSVVLPAILVTLALVGALFVAGVFGADDPTPTSSRGAPPAAPPPVATTTPEVVVVPGAGDAAAAAVEKAKAKARSRAQRSRPSRPARTSATPPPAAAVTPPPPAAPSSSNATATKPQPTRTRTPKASNTGSGRGGVGVDAKNGATGAEQLPPAQDTSTVPELAPPPEPAIPTPPPG